VARLNPRKGLAMKAQYIGKRYGSGYDRDMVYLEYEYRGHRYEVYENRAKGNEPLSWQHRNEQARIDSIIKAESNQRDAQPIDFDEIWQMLGWD
jgi:hypothetical protein